MKKILYFILTFAVVFLLLGSTVAFAEEVVESADVPSTESDDVNFFTRLYEAFTENKTYIFTLGGSAVLFVNSMILKKDLGATSRNVVDNIARVLSKTDITAEQQKAMVDGLNEMVDGYNEIKDLSQRVAEQLEGHGDQISSVLESNAEMQTKLSECFTIIISLIDKEILQNAEVMEVLSSIYTNNTKLPQGIKDFVSLKRTENAKLVQEAAELMHKGEGGAVNE